jgi:hypothetical protein
MVELSAQVVALAQQQACALPSHGTPLSARNRPAPPASEVLLTPPAWWPRGAAARPAADPPPLPLPPVPTSAAAKSPPRTQQRVAEQAVLCCVRWAAAVAGDVPAEALAVLQTSGPARAVVLAWMLGDDAAFAQVGCRRRTWRARSRPCLLRFRAQTAED